MADGLWVPTQVKKGKDPNAPKRPMSAYMLWLNASREKIKSDHPGISVTDLSKKAGEIWKGMSKEKKEARATRTHHREPGAGWRRAGPGRRFCAGFACIGAGGLSFIFFLFISFRVCVCVCVCARACVCVCGVGPQG